MPTVAEFFVALPILFATLLLPVYCKGADAMDEKRARAREGKL